jgi:hypothetical protein
MSNSFPTAKSQTKRDERQKLRRVIERRGLCGLADNAKWDEFVESIRSREGWRPKFRDKCIDGPPSQWNYEWCYHLPFLLMPVEWLDVAFLQETREHPLPPKVYTVDL